MIYFRLMFTGLLGSFCILNLVVLSNFHTLYVVSMMPRSALVNIYEKLLSECGKFLDEKFRNRAIRAVKHIYEQHLDETDEANLSCLITRAEEDLEVIQQQLEEQSKSDRQEGSVSNEVITDKEERIKCFRKRAKAIIKMAKHLHRTTGAKVEVEIINPDDPREIYRYSSHPKAVRSVKVQAENGMLPGGQDRPTRSCTGRKRSGDGQSSKISFVKKPPHYRL